MAFLFDPFFLWIDGWDQSGSLLHSQCWATDLAVALARGVELAGIDASARVLFHVYDPLLFPPAHRDVDLACRPVHQKNTSTPKGFHHLLQHVCGGRIIKVVVRVEPHHSPVVVVVQQYSSSTGLRSVVRHDPRSRKGNATSLNLNPRSVANKKIYPGAVVWLVRTTTSATSPRAVKPSITPMAREDGALISRYILTTVAVW